MASNFFGGNRSSYSYGNQGRKKKFVGGGGGVGKFPSLNSGNYIPGLNCARGGRNYSEIAEKTTL